MKRVLLILYVLTLIVFLSFSVYLCIKIYDLPFTHRDFEHLFTKGQIIPGLNVLLGVPSFIYGIKFLSFSSSKPENKSLDEHLMHNKQQIFKRKLGLDICLTLFSILLLSLVFLLLYLWEIDPPQGEDFIFVLIVVIGLILFWMLSLNLIIQIFKSYKKPKTSHKE